VRQLMTKISLVMLIPMTIYAWRMGLPDRTAGTGGWNGQRPSIEIAFCIDTTSSMDSYIAAVKERVREIMKSTTEWKSHPTVRMAVVAYRDVGDDYLTQKDDFTDDVERTRTFLSNLRAEGGGDVPEHVTAGLRATVEQLSWSSDQKTLKLIYLIGDAPAHSDYKDGDYHPVVGAARDRAIIIHTVGCSFQPRMFEQWKDIARLTGGQYFQLENLTGSGAGVTDTLGRMIDESLETAARRRGILN
jgi:Mg-chelatase subunit ChlD